MRYFSILLSAVKDLPQRALQVVLGAIMVALVVIVIWFAWTSQIAENSRTVADGRELLTTEILYETSEILSATKDIETGQRGYLLTFDNIFLGPYALGKQKLPGRFSMLRSLAADSPEQQERLAALESLVDDRIRIAERGLSMARDATGTGDIQLQLHRDGKAKMDAIRHLISQIVAHEQELLAINRSDAKFAATQVDRFSSLFSIVVMILVILVGAAFWILLQQRRNVLDQRIEMAAAKQTEGVLQADNAELEAQVARRTESLTEAVASLQREIEEREAAETRLRQMEKMESLGQLTGGIAHDFNNMLAIIMGSLDMARRRMPAEAKALSKALDNAQEGAERAASLTARLLAYARQQPLAPQYVDVNELVTSVGDVLSRTLGDNIDVQLELAPNVGYIHIDRPQLESALINLAVNARDAMPRGGSLMIESKRGKDQVQIILSDTGTGMAPEIIDKVFDPFFTTKEVGKGTGLGLSQVHGFIAQSGGNIAIRSRPGEGTAVELSFEAAQSPVLFEKIPNSSVERAETIKVCILVVEDEALVRLVAVETLREIGHVVHMADNGPAALAIILAHPEIELLLTDVAMPQMDGRELANAACQMRPSLKVLFTTGYDAHGVADSKSVLHKPYLAEELAEAVQDVMYRGVVSPPDLPKHVSAGPGGT
jgi:signal transduction histidine kinase